MRFKKGDVVVAKEDFLDDGETLQSTAALVLEYTADNDYLLLGSLHPEKHAIPPTFSGRGEYYRHITEQEKQDWNII